MVVQHNTSVTKKTLSGQDFCKCPPCEERQNSIYPTTSDDQVIISKVGNTLEEWLNIEEGGSVSNSLKTWLQNNWSMSHYVLPEATTSTLGGVIIDPTYLTIENGRLSIDIQRLNIPEIVQTTFQDLGSIRLGNSTILTSSFIDATIGGQQHDNYSYTGHVYAFPLRLDNNGRAGIAIPTALFSEGGSEDTSVWTLDYSKKVENVIISPVEAGVSTNYVLLGNKNVSTNNGELGYDSNGNLSTGCGYPRLALVAGTGVHFQRYTNRFISPADNYWGDNITELVISSEPPEVYNDFIGSDGYNAGEHGLVPAPAINDNNKFLKGDGTWEQVPTYTAGEGINFTNSTTINQSVTTNNTLGGIKIGYTNENTDYKPVELDSNNRAYVNITNVNFKNHEVIAKNHAVWDQYDDYFDTLTVKCKLSNDNLTVVNINDFKKPDTQYTDKVLGIDEDIVYEWPITTAGSNNTIAIIDVTSTAAKGYFKLEIESDDGIEESHNVGFVVDTPSSGTFAWFSTCAWAVSLYEGIYANSYRVYLTAPNNFTGKVRITNKIVIRPSSYGVNIGSMSGNTKVGWDSDTAFTDGSITNISGTLVSTPQYTDQAQTKICIPSGYKIPVDAFVTVNETPQVGTLLYDNEINDALLHNLLVRVKSIENWIQSQS